MTLDRYVVNKKTYMVPIVPDKFIDLDGARNTVCQLQQCINDIIQSLRPISIGTGDGNVVGPIIAVDSDVVEFNTTTGKLIKDGSLTHTNVADAVSKKHSQGTDTAFGGLGTKNSPIDADKAIYRNSVASDALVTSTWVQIKAFLKTYFDTLYVAVIGKYRYAAAIADDETVVLPTITANFSAFLEITLSSSGVIDANAKCIIDSTGTITKQHDSGDATVAYNADIDGKLCIGTATTQNPLNIKNRFGGAKNILMIMNYN